MGIFSKETSYLGVDFDSKSIKVVELSEASGRPKLVTYGYLDFDIEKEIEEKQKVIQIGAYLKEVCKKSNTKTRMAVVSLPTYEVFSSIITIPKVEKKDFPPVINAEAKKVTPMPLEEMALDWHVISKKFESGNEKQKQAPQDDKIDQVRDVLKISKDGHDNQRVLISAVEKKLIETRSAIIKEAGLMLVGIENDTFALMRSLVGRDLANVMIVDISATVTNIIVISKSIPVVTKTMDFGGLAITKALAENLNISLLRAEQFKYDIGLGSGETAESKIPLLIQELVKTLVQEIRYTVDQFSGKDQTRIEKIILTGGSSLLVNLPQYLAKQLDKKVYLGDPWARVECSEELKPILDEIGPRFATSIGLVMGMYRGKDAIDIKMNYLKSINKKKIDKEVQ
ncbi:pilus assembly protein PilM [Patescibacteria group bacterium]|nr:pilus assembly protein PilM [Patescibacteria group bacterium]